MAREAAKFKVGSTFTKRITRGPNKGDLVRFKVAPSKKPFPIRVIEDKSGNSTLRDNAGVKFGKPPKGTKLRRIDKPMPTNAPKVRTKRQKLTL